MPVFRRTKRWLLLLTGLLLSSILLAACGENSPSILDAHGPVAQSESFVFWVILGIATVIFLFVETWLVFAIVRYRGRPDAPNPRQIHGDMRLEVIWTVIPTLALFVILFFTIRGLIEVAPESQPAGDAVNVTVVGHQWWWEFYYPQYNITTADTMVIPVGKTIHVDLYSNNVIHSFWVPQLTGKTDVVPGHANTKWFVANPETVGQSYWGLCTEYCGMQHANMKFQVHVDNANDFMTWVSAQQQVAAAPAAGSLADQGAKIFQQQCTSCHGIVGVDLQSIQDPQKTCDDPKAACLVGPNLTHFGSRNLIAGGVLDYTTASCDPTDPNLVQHCNLAKWLHDPQGVKPGNDMAIGQLTDQQIGQLVAYLESLK